MDSNEKKEILETVVTYLTGALDEAKDELAVLEKKVLRKCKKCQTNEHLLFRHWEFACGEPNHLDERFSFGCTKCGEDIGEYCPDNKELAREKWGYEENGKVGTVKPPEPEPPTLHNLDWGIDHGGGFRFFMQYRDKFEAYDSKGNCRKKNVLKSQTSNGVYTIKGNLQSIFEQLAIDDMVSNVAGAIKEMALKSGYVEPDRKFPRQQEDSQGYCPECQAKIIAAKDGEFVPICAKCLIGASREFYLKKVV